MKTNTTVTVDSTITTYVSRVRKLLKKGCTPGEIASTMQKPLKEVRVWIKIVKDVDKRNERIKKLRNKGNTIQTIAEAEGVSESTVRRVLKGA